MGSMLNTSPNASSSSNANIAKAKPKASAAIALGVVAALIGGAFVAGPASAKTSIQGGQNACKAAFQSQTPAPSSLRVDANETKATGDTLIYAYKVKTAGDDKVATATCTVDRTTSAATITMEAAPATTLAAR